MKLKHYYTLCISVVVFALLEALVWEHLLAILITAFICLSAWYISNKKHLERYNKVVENNINLCKKLEAIEANNNNLFAAHTHLSVRYKKICGILKVIKNNMVKEVATFGGSVDLKIPQSEAAMRLGSKVHNKTISLERSNYEQE